MSAALTLAILQARVSDQLLFISTIWFKNENNEFEMSPHAGPAEIVSGPG